MPTITNQMGSVDTGINTTFIQEINEALNQHQLLTVRDISKIRTMLKYIYKHVMKLTSDKAIVPLGEGDESR